MITTKFQNAGIRYHIEHGASRREFEERALDIRPDPTLWTTGQKRQALALRVDEISARKKEKS